MFILGLRRPTNRDGFVKLARTVKKRCAELFRDVGFVIQTQGDPNPTIVTDEFIAQFKPKLTRGKIDKLNKANGVQIVRQEPGATVIQVDPEILSGRPVFAGTRVPVETLLEYLERGRSLGEFVSDFPSVTEEQAVAALEEAKEALLARAPRPPQSAAGTRLIRAVEGEGADPGPRTALWSKGSFPSVSATNRNTQEPACLTTFQTSPN